MYNKGREFYPFIKGSVREAQFEHANAANEGFRVKFEQIINARIQREIDEQSKGCKCLGCKS